MARSKNPKFAVLDQTRMESAARLFAALAEPTRLRILQLLHDGPLGVGQLVRQMHVKQANVSKQLGILHQAGLLSRSRQGNAVLYAIREPIIIDLCDLVCRKMHQDAAEQYRALGGDGAHR